MSQNPLLREVNFVPFPPKYADHTIFRIDLVLQQNNTPSLVSWEFLTQLLLNLFYFYSVVTVDQQQ